MLEPDPELCITYGLFSVSQALRAGYSRADVERLVRRGRWKRVGRGVLAAHGRASAPGDAVVAAVLAAPPGAVVGFESAAALHGWDLLREPRHVQLILPPGSTCGSGYRTRLTPEDVQLHGVVRVSTSSRTALDIACSSPFEPAVIAVDSALRSGQATMAELRRRFMGSPRHGIRAGRHALAHADPRSGSVPETQSRLLFAAAGLPTPATQYPVFVQQRLIAVFDFAWEAARLAAEIDGRAYHSGEADFQRDRTRQNAVQLEGWLVLRFTVGDIRESPQRVVGEVRRALAQRLAA